MEGSHGDSSNSGQFVLEDAIMKIRLLVKSVLLPGLKLYVAFALLSVPLAASAQGILAAPQTGTVQVLRQDDGYLTISGREFAFDNEVAEVYLNGERVGAEVLDEGMVVRFTINRAGALVRLEILGPIDKIRVLEEN